MPDKVSQQ